MNSLFRISCRTFSQLPKTALQGFDTRLNFNSNFNLVRSFHISDSRREEGEKVTKASRKRERLLNDPRHDRRTVIPVEVSIKYLQSKAYQDCYGDEPVWTHYRRNHKGQIPPNKTRKMCIRNGVIFTRNPCPVCRDEYLIVDYKNTELLKQFISSYTGEVISYQKTGVCQKQHEKILVAYLQAKDFGLITFNVPFREYDYSEYEIK